MVCSKDRKSQDEDDPAGSNSDDAEANTNVDSGDEDEDDGTEWKTDMSAEAVARRQAEQLTQAAASLVQGPAVRFLDTCLLLNIRGMSACTSSVRSVINMHPPPTPPHRPRKCRYFLPTSLNLSVFVSVYAACLCGRDTSSTVQRVRSARNDCRW